MKLKPNQTLYIGGKKFTGEVPDKIAELNKNNPKKEEPPKGNTGKKVK
jgi:hypothetical protein